MTIQSDVFGRALGLCTLLALGAFSQTPAPVAARTNWTIDPARTQIAFAIDAVGYPRTEGHFRRFEGRISVDFERPEKSSVAFHVQSGSVDVGSASFSDYLRSAAFLDSDRYPSIDFVSTSVQRVNDHMVRVSGDLTLLGVTKPLSIDVAVTRDAGGGRQRLDFQAETRIDRLEFGMNSGYPLVSREVRLVISSAATEL
ncbi:MAG: YceI family protein [Hyphomicrobiales bacterium]|nr:YceI family protein [Hyphomicrobiales bacterium]